VPVLGQIIIAYHQPHPFKACWVQLKQPGAVPERKQQQQKQQQQHKWAAMGAATAVSIRVRARKSMSNLLLLLAQWLHLFGGFRRSS
jgi:hypothetical protein